MRSRSANLGFKRAAFCLLMFALVSSANGAIFTGLGDLPGGQNFSTATAISADGSTVVGYSDTTAGYEAFRWNAITGMTGLGDFAGGDFDSVAYGVSANGSVIVGYGTVASTATFRTGMLRAFRWTSSGGMASLGIGESIAHGISADGSVIVGEFDDSSYGAQPVRWSSSGDMAILTNFLFSLRYATSVSADGSVITGSNSSFSSHQEAYRWTSSDGMVGLGGTNTSATGISADGSVVVGYGSSALGTEAFRWTNSKGVVGLGYLPGADFYSKATGVSADGSVIVGFDESTSEEAAFIWDATNGMRDLQDVLSPSVGDAVNGWTLLNATAISADGLTVAGYGIDPTGNRQAWLAYLGSEVPEPAAWILIGLGSMGVVARHKPPRQI